MELVFSEVHSRRLRGNAPLLDYGKFLLDIMAKQNHLFKHWKWLSTEVVGSLFLEIFKTWVEKL